MGSQVERALLAELQRLRLVVEDDLHLAGQTTVWEGDVVRPAQNLLAAARCLRAGVPERVVQYRYQIDKVVNRRRVLTEWLSQLEAEWVLAEIGQEMVVCLGELGERLETGLRSPESVGELKQLCRGEDPEMVDDGSELICGIVGPVQSELGDTLVRVFTRRVTKSGAAVAVMPTYLYKWLFRHLAKKSEAMLLPELSEPVRAGEDVDRLCEVVAGLWSPRLVTVPAGELLSDFYAVVEAARSCLYE